MLISALEGTHVIAGFESFLLNFRYFGTGLVWKDYRSQRLAVEVNRAIKCFTIKGTDDSKRDSPDGDLFFSTFGNTELSGHLFF